MTPLTRPQAAPADPGRVPTAVPPGSGCGIAKGTSTRSRQSGQRRRRKTIILAAPTVCATPSRGHPRRESLGTPQSPNCAALCPPGRLQQTPRLGGSLAVERGTAIGGDQPSRPCDSCGTPDRVEYGGGSETRPRAGSGRPEPVQFCEGERSIVVLDVVLDVEDETPLPATVLGSA